MVAVTFLAGLEAVAATVFVIRLASRFGRRRPAGAKT